MTSIRRWEYATLEFWASAKQEERPSGVVRYVYLNDFYLRRPGDEEAEKREGWTSKDTADIKHRVLDLLNELGAEGWELVSDSVLRSGLNTVVQGWDNSSETVHRVLILKRPAAAE